MSCFVNTITTFCWLDYIYAEGNIVAVRVYENGVGSLYYVLTDHLGSWEKVLDQSKTVVQQTHFDPWGNRMSYAAWNTQQTQAAFTFDRGFTGHEHYDCMHVINANARLYDPVIGRFFSPDPFVQAPEGTQGFNRYSYCMNNPVMYSDPDGEFAWFIPIIVGAVVFSGRSGSAPRGKPRASGSRSKQNSKNRHENENTNHRAAWLAGCCQIASPRGNVPRHGVRPSLDDGQPIHAL